ncbi:uncharacterized tRNA/rRNA methyltransferase slr1673-like isoform X2 [Tripterygium wilfordii]|uniref:uncharacterized tRNA/rRNA methyltransferase slr1673-like isoform X2 n=1 Tax=Tripterygium wilfordii TaxID=458696 RepID=UPI0018F7F86A|nr:uncharacterized tRNA/rRNA methyltransferase slr1673-like isoform X2 [Tripterygium wilfordii]
MQCSYASWVSTPSSSQFLKLSNPKVNLAIAQRTQFQRNSSYQGYGFENTDNLVGFDFRLPSHVESITSTSNPFVKHCLKLRNSSSYRHSHGSVLVVGATPIRYWETLEGRAVGIDCLLLLDKAEIPEGLDDMSVHIVRVSSAVIKKLSGVQSTESTEAIALMRISTNFSNVDVSQNSADCKTWFPFPHRVLVLDGIQESSGHVASLIHESCSMQDPGNLGTLIRSAVAFRWGGVFLLPGCCDPFNEKALRASRGASFQLPIVSGSWNDLEALEDEFQLRMLAGHSASDREMKQLSSLSQGYTESLVDVPLCLVLGSEGLGLSEKSRQKCELVSIPMAGRFESLNVSVAGGIFLYMLQPRNNQMFV